MPDATENISIQNINLQMIELRKETNQGFIRLEDAMIENGRQNAETSRQLAAAVAESSKNYLVTNNRIDSIEKLVVDHAKKIESIDMAVSVIETFITRIKARAGIIISLCVLTWAVGTWVYSGPYQDMKQKDVSTSEVLTKMVEALEKMQGNP